MSDKHLAPSLLEQQVMNRKTESGYGSVLPQRCRRLRKMHFLALTEEGTLKLRKLLAHSNPSATFFKIITRLNLRRLKTENRQHHVKLLYKNNENGEQLIKIL